MATTSPVAQFRSNRFDNVARLYPAGEPVYRRQQGGNHGRRIQPLVLGNGFRLEDSSQHHTIGNSQALRQLMLEHLAAQRVRARLQDCPQSTPRITRAHRLQRLRNRRRVMREIVDDGDPATSAFTSRRRLTLRKLRSAAAISSFADPVICGHGGGCGCVQHVVFAGQGKLEFCPTAPPSRRHFPARRCGRVLHIRDSPM